MQLVPLAHPDEDIFYQEDRQLTNALGSELDWQQYERRTSCDAVRRAKLVGGLDVNRRPASLLEIGCGYGAFLHHVQETYSNVIGIDPGRNRVRHCRNRGLQVFEGFFPTDDVDDRFDVICAFHVLEHVTDPLTFLEAVASHLAPKGLFVVEVPNYADLMNELSRPYLAYHFQGAHKYYYDGETLISLLKRTFSRIEIRYVQRYSIDNHIQWLEEGCPQLSDPARWGSSQVDMQYATFLASEGRTDTIVAIAQP